MLIRAAALLLLMCAPALAQEGLVVFAASSLTEALTSAGSLYAKAGHRAPVFAFAASSALARQIENGAPAGLFLSADEEWMDYLAQRGLIAAESRVSLLGNTLVLVVPKGETLGVTVAPGFDLASALKGRKLALADPASVPAGRYARAALESLGVWQGVAPLVVRADNVRGALMFVERKEAAAGIVYATDAALTRKVDVVGEFPAGSYRAIIYPLAIVSRNDSPEARAFRDFLLTGPAKDVFRGYGFAVK